jgi:3',5'-cyclic AMP phosphodiesterase CpdA
MSVLNAIPKQVGVPVLLAVLGLAVGLLTYIEVREERLQLPATCQVPTALGKLDPLSYEVSFAIFGDNKKHVGIFSDIMRAAEKDADIAAVINTGDLVPTGKIGEYRDLLEIIGQTSRKPFLPVPGNHDFRNGSSLAYSKAFGTLHYTFHAAKRLWICLNTANELTAEELAWLKGVLAKNDPATPKIIVMHIPPIDPRPGGNHCLDASSAAALGNVLQHASVEHIFAGHIHGFFQGVWQGIPVTITGGGGARLYSTDPKHGFYHYLKVSVGSQGIDLVPVTVHDGAATNSKRLETILVRLQDEFVEWFLMGLILVSGLALLAFFLKNRSRLFQSSSES